MRASSFSSHCRSITLAATASSSLPPTRQIVLESLLALFLGIIGACLQAPAVKEITWVSEMKSRCAKHKVTLLTRQLTFGFPAAAASSCVGYGFRLIDDMDARMEFANFVTRGRVLGQDRTNRAGQRRG